MHSSMDKFWQGFKLSVELVDLRKLCVDSMSDLGYCAVNYDFNVLET